MIPIVFDGCFGWFHPGGRARGVVLCGPIGDEADFVHRVWRQFAESLAAAGISTLRFDYPGTRDSLEFDPSSGALPAWTHSIAAAARWLRTEALVEDVVLVGMRFGAALAVKCAEDLGGIDRMALLAPVASGAAYQREVCMLAGVSRSASRPRETLGPGNAGALFSMDSIIDVQKLEICQGDTCPARRILILSAPVAPGGQKLLGRLRALGAEVEVEPFLDYPALMTVPESARYPKFAFDKVIGWLKADLTPSRHGIALYTSASPSLAFPNGRETPVFFGEGAGLFGISCAPARPRGDRPAIVFINTSAISHAGMNRMWVTMARRLAALGFASLRFDIAGLGDSPAHPLRPDPLEQVKEAFGDVGAAIGWLKRQGCANVTLVGFCWGAQLACNVAQADDRVTGLVMINSRRFFWDATSAHHPSRTVQRCLRLARDPAKWLGVLRGDIPLADVFHVATQLIHGVIASGQTEAERAETARGGAARRLRSLRARGVDALMIHGQDDPFLVEFEDYFAVPRHALEGLFHIRTRFIDRVDHLFRSQQTLSELGDVLLEHFAVPARSISPRGEVVSGLSAPLQAAQPRAR